MIRAVIADDEPLSRRLVHQLLERHADVRIVAECADGGAVRAAIVEQRPDVLFLDIRMPVESGLTIARTNGACHSRESPLIVFVTAYDMFAVPAFETDAVDYLTKPLGEERFDAALARVRDRLRLRRNADRFEALTSTSGQGRAPHLVARIGARDVIIPLETIDYIEADDVYAAVVARGRRLFVRTSLDTLERTLDPLAFARIHRSYIVRRDRVTEIRRDRRSGLTVVLAGDVELPVSRRRRAILETLVRPLTT